MKLFGNSAGLKKSSLKKLERLYQRHHGKQQLIRKDVAHELCSLSQETGRQIGLLIDRRGEVKYVVVGSRKQIILPAFPRMRVGQRRLRGLRYIHTHLDSSPLSQEDLNDTAFLRLDFCLALTVGEDGLAHMAHPAHLLPRNKERKIWQLFKPTPFANFKLDFQQLIKSLEEEWVRSLPRPVEAGGKQRAILIDVRKRQDPFAEESLAELEELAIASGVQLVDRVIQIRNKPDAKFLIGIGKLRQITLESHQEGVDLLIFNQNLQPSQIRQIGDETDLKILDRTQLILDIFAQHARSREGKIQVELAQLRYSLPRLSEKDDMLSRLTGGIGGRGPGETKLEIDNRRVRERINRLEKQIKQISRQRFEQRRQRQRKNLPIISIVGYTNAGKSTLLNSLTNSEVLVIDQPFATLDPASKRLRFPREREVVITDTVGFIRQLPNDLISAFKATLEELTEADLLLHVIDMANDNFEEHINVVDNLLLELGIAAIPKLQLFNKRDLVDPLKAKMFAKKHRGLAICANDQQSLLPLLKKIEELLWPEKNPD